MKSGIKILLLLIASIVLFSCSTTKYVKEGDFLLKNNKIIIENAHPAIQSGDISDQIQQKPNKRIFGLLPLKLIYHSLFIKKGEEPVILDNIQITNSKEKISKYLMSSGFFNSKVNHEITYPSKKKAKVNYLISLSQPYSIRKMNYVVDDSKMYNILKKYRILAIIDEGDIYNEYLLDDERDRITSLLNNNGYYRFSKDFIFYRVDSSLINHQVSIEVVIKNKTELLGEETKKSIHKKYLLNNVIVYPNHDFFRIDSSGSDTIFVNPMRHIKKLKEHPHIFIYKDPLKIKPRAISRAVFFKSGDFYEADAVQSTYNRLNKLGVFKKANIQFIEIPFNNNDSIGYLNCNIQLEKRPSHAYSLELNGTNKGGDLGVGGYLSYQNRNLFRGAELLSIRLKGGIEFQKGGFFEEEGIGEELKYFTTYETGLDSKLLFPVFLAPIRFKNFTKLINPKTSILLGYNHQNRRDYIKTNSFLSFGYNWTTNIRHEHQLYPLDINLVKVEKSESFKEILLNQPLRLQDLYKDHLIFSLRYSYIYNGQNIYKLKNFIYYRGNIEPSGNILAAASNLFGNKEEQEYKTLFNIRYAQFFKTDHDLRYYIFLQKDHSLAFRTHFGIGISYGNSVDLPLGKAFYGGGANGMRGWRLRYLGPGSYKNTDQNIESFGDLIIEGNFEYRFPVYRYFKGAIFYDIGNLWMIRENETYPGGEFLLNRFYKELAMDAGVGLRVDFSYFLIRIDIAQKIKDPVLDLGQRWVFTHKGWFDPVLNFGIGYPF